MDDLEDIMQGMPDVFLNGCIQLGKFARCSLRNAAIFSQTLNLHPTILCKQQDAAPKPALSLSKGFGIPIRSGIQQPSAGRVLDPRKRGSPFVGAYVASKYALEGLSESLRMELMLYGIDVIVIEPGVITTPIWDKGEKEDISLYKDTEYGRFIERFQKYMVQHGKKGYPPEKVGEVVLHALTTSRPRVRYAVVPNALTSWIIPMLLPARWTDKIVARGLGFKK